MEAVVVENLNEQILEAECSSIPLAAVDKPADEDTVNAVDLAEVEGEDFEDVGLQHWFPVFKKDKPVYTELVTDQTLSVTAFEEVVDKSEESWGGNWIYNNLNMIFCLNLFYSVFKLKLFILWIYIFVRQLHFFAPAWLEILG